MKGATKRHPRLGELPAAWPVGRFGRYVEFRSGQIDPEDEAFMNHVLIAPNHIEAGTGRLLATESAADQGAESGKYWCDAGDVIYSKIRPALRKVTLAPFDCLCSADMYPLKGVRGLTNRFLKWFLLSVPFSDFAVQESARVAMPKLNRETLAAAPIPVPCIDEQKSIADFLDVQTARIDALIAEKEGLICSLGELRLSEISEAVGAGKGPELAPGADLSYLFPSRPAGWTLTRIGFLATKIGSGKTPSGGAEVYVSQGIPLIRSMNVYDEGMRLDELAFITPEMDEELAATRLLVDDILLNITGASIGRSCAVPETVLPANINQHACLIRLRNKSLVRFVSLAMKSAQTKAQIDAFQNGAAREGLNFAQVARIAILLPDSVERAEAVAAHVERRLAQIDVACQHTLEHIERLREYRSSLISAAVTGQLDISAYPSKAVASAEEALV